MNPTDPPDRIPVSILTGFLGSGKTTLLNHLLTRGEAADTAVIVNELGEIALDHLLIESSTDNVRVLASGCICCVVQNGLKETLADLFVRRVNGSVPPFRRVVVETTGLADPGPIVNSLNADALVRERFALDGVVTTVDAMHGLDQIERHPEALRQVLLADSIVITKTDLTGSDVLAPLEARLDALAPNAARVTGMRGMVPSSFVLPRAGERRAWLGTLDAHRRGLALRAMHTLNVESTAQVLDTASSWAGLAAWTQLAASQFGARLLRVKGLIEIAEIGRPVALHGIAGYFHRPEPLARWPSEDHRSRLVCIAQGVDRDELLRSFRAFTLAPGTPPPRSLDDLPDMETAR